MSKVLVRPKSLVAKLFSFGSQCLSKLLLSTLVALIVLSTAEAAGPLRVNSANPRYFFDSNETPVYLAGTYRAHEQIALSAKDFPAYLDFLQQQKHNFTRLWAWEQTPLTAKVALSTLPYERTGPGQALDGGNKFDLGRLNQAYFDQLRARVVQAAQRGVYVSVVLFQSLNAQSTTNQVNNPWSANPFNRDNNVNRIDGDSNRDGLGDESFTLAIPAITSHQQAYIRKVVDTLNDLDNVLYEISGDSLLGSSAWQYDIIKYLKSYQAAKVNQHPVGIGYLSGTNTDAAFNSPADWIAFAGADLNPPVAAGGKVLFLEVNPSLLGGGSSYQSVWKSFARGFNVINKELDTLTPGVSESLHAAITQSLAYAQFLNLSAMTPSDVVCPSGYCLVKPGAEYLVYLPSGGRVSIDLSAARQNFLVTWFDPKTGKTVAGNTVAGGGQAALTSPITGETVLHLLAQTQASSQVSATSNTSGTASGVTLSTPSSPAVTSASKTLSATGASSIATIVGTPTITPNGAAFAGSVSVSLSVATSGATIYYTTDGSSPTQTSKKYTAPITLSTDALVKVKAFKTNSIPSPETTAWFAKTSSSTSAVIGGTNLVAYWKFDEATGITTADSSGNGNTATLVNGPVRAKGIVGNALYFDGVNDNVTILNATTLNPSRFTVSAWVNPAATFKDFRSILVKNYKYYLYASVDGYCGDGSPLGGFSEATDNTVCQPSPLPTNNWTHLSLAYDGSTLTLYRNGVAVATSAAKGTPSPTAGTLQIGASQYGEYFKGLIDEVRIYNRALTNTEIQALYQQTGATVSAANVWTFCANESERCTFSGTKEVRYGANAAYVSRSLTNGTLCANSVFGDPAPGLGKECAYKDTSAPPSDGGAAAVVVATPTITPNGGSFTNPVSVALATTTSGASIYYTTNGSSPTQLSTLYSGPMTLANSAAVKAKAFKTGSNASAEATASFTITTPVANVWNFCANESERCAFSGAKEVRYGANGAYVSRSLTNGTLCANSVFGDPAPGLGKECAYKDTSAQPFNFSLTNAGTISVTVGSSASTVIGANAVSGSSQPISFKVSGLPSGASGSFASASCNPTCSTVLTVRTSGSTPAGSFPVTVTALGGSVTKITSFTLSVSAAAALVVATPTITPNGGSFTNPTPVTLATTTSGASIYYTTNGSSPTQSSTLYNGAITLTNNAAVKAKAFKVGSNASAEATASFTIAAPVANIWNFCANESERCTFSGTKEVRYGANGAYVSRSLTNGTLCDNSVFGDPAPGLGKECAYKDTTALPSNTGVIAPVAATPTITPNGGNFTGSVSVSMLSGTSGSSIRYTTDGSMPTESSTLYAGAMTLTSNTTVNAKVFKSGSSPSAVAAATFTTSVTSTAGTGKTYYVATNGSDAYSCAQAQNQANPKQSIQAGINCMTGGDALVLKAGSYSRPSNQPPSGTSWSNATKIMRYGSDRVTVNGWPAFYASNVQYIVLDGLIIDASGSPSDEAVMIGNGAHHIRIMNSALSKGRRQGVFVDKTSGYNEIINSTIHDNGTTQIYDHGLYIEGSNNLIDGCRIYNNAAYGVHLYSGYGQTSNNNVVRNNQIFANNRLGSWPFAMVIRSGSGALVYNNIIRDNANGGIQIGSDAIGAKVLNNTIYGNRGPAIYVYAGNRGTIVKNNIMFQNNGTLTSEVNDIVASNNLTTTPMFKNPAAGDFSLQSGSPAIKAGAAVGEVQIDFNYNPRPKGTAYTIGAFEY